MFFRFLVRHGALAMILLDASLHLLAGPVLALATSVTHLRNEPTASSSSESQPVDMLQETGNRELQSELLGSVTVTAYVYTGLLGPSVFAPLAGAGIVLQDDSFAFDPTYGDSGVTDANGTIVFTNVPPRQYIVDTVRNQPPGYFIGDRGSDLERPVTVSASNLNVEVLPFVYEPPPVGSISGTVTEDTDNDGIGDIPLAGFLVSLLSDTCCDDFINLNLTTLTDSDGNYEFTRLWNNEYTISASGIGSLTLTLPGALPMNSTANNFILQRTPTDCSNISCPDGSACDIGVNGFPECIQDVTPARFTEFSWFSDIMQNFDSSNGNRLKKCGKRQDQPPTNGVGCAPLPKTCYFRTQLCNGTPTPMTECYCDGKQGSQTWTCTPINCP